MDTDTTKPEFQLPCSFTIDIIRTYGRKPTDDLDEDGLPIMVTDPDCSRFRAVITAKEAFQPTALRRMVIESPQFCNEEPFGGMQAWRAVLDMLQHSIACAVIPADQRPQYELEETESGIKFKAKLP